jgi:hypothetical protein
MRCVGCLIEAAVLGFVVTFLSCFALDGQAAANLGIVAELSWAIYAIVLPCLRSLAAASQINPQRVPTAHFGIKVRSK